MREFESVTLLFDFFDFLVPVILNCIIDQSYYLTFNHNAHFSDTIYLSLLTFMYSIYTIVNVVPLALNAQIAG